ncbi:MAG: molybdenum cofactor biosynthesis protein A [bacterium ADurb.Bin429]|nr:MAG: molybdenum cofactor biosynthesis protein A [bacterium ADurb.Bin429]
MTYLFGPVPSRRLGRSLGVDVIPYKSCTYNCIYCQLGATTKLTTEREAFIPVEAVLAELDGTLCRGDTPDYITLAGSGEPTLYAELGTLIADIKARTSIPVAVITNGSLLWDTSVRAAVCQADLVMPSLDAGNETLFRCINRPHPEISFARMVDGLTALRMDYHGSIWLEVMLLAGMTAFAAEVEKIKRYLERIKPDRVQVNTVVRPPAKDFALPVSAERLQVLAQQLGENAEVIFDTQHSHDTPSAGTTRLDIINLLKRRPCSLDDIAHGLHMHPNEVIKHLTYLHAHQCVNIVYRRGRRYYSVPQHSCAETAHEMR